MKLAVNWKLTGLFVLGMIWGAGLTFIAGVLFLRHSLVQEWQSPLPYEEVVKFLPEKAAAMPGWTVQSAGCTLPASPDGSRMQTFRLCHREYAAEMIAAESDRKISSLLPCTFTVYEKKDGSTCLSRLDVSLVGYLLGGMPAYTLPRRVSPDQERMLRSLRFH